MKVILLAACSAVLVAACSKTPLPVEPVASPAVIRAPAAPKHLYAIHDGNEYGYEAALSDEQRAQGRAAAEIKMFNYLGRKGSTLQVMMRADDMRSVAECTLPCEFAKVYLFSNTTFISKEVMRLGPDAILTAVFLDAALGRLDQVHGVPRNGVDTTLWIDGERRRLVVEDAKKSGVTRD